MSKQIAVIGGGIHGLSIALALAEKGAAVVLFEKAPKLFMGTSGATHNRAHMGYHYPKSVETALECQNGLELFKNKYPEVLHWPEEGYYVVAKDGSRTSVEDYIKFCQKINIPSEMKWPAEHLLFRESISASIFSPEPVFNTELLVKTLEEKCLTLGVKIKTDAEVIGGEKNLGGQFKIITREGGMQVAYNATVVINATYAYANNILKVFGMEKYMTKYRLQTTEVVVVRSAINVPPLTIMDGPFMSIMVYVGNPQLYLVYDVEHSVAEEIHGHMFDDGKTFSSNWEKMKIKGRKYFPFIDQLEYVRSLWGSRPVPVDSALQSRKTRLVKYSDYPGFYSLLEGKFISAPFVAEQLVKMIREDNFL